MSACLSVVYACVVHCCQWGMIIRLLIPLILMLCESVIENEMSDWVWHCMWSSLNSTSRHHWAPNTKQGTIIQLSRWRECKWTILQLANNLQRLEINEAVHWASMRKYERVKSYTSSNLSLINIIEIIKPFCLCFLFTVYFDLPQDFCKTTHTSTEKMRHCFCLLAFCFHSIIVAIKHN